MLSFALFVYLCNFECFCSFFLDFSSSLMLACLFQVFYAVYIKFHLFKIFWTEKYIFWFFDLFESKTLKSFFNWALSKALARKHGWRFTARSDVQAAQEAPQETFDMYLKLPMSGPPRWRLGGVLDTLFSWTTSCRYIALCKCVC